MARGLLRSEHTLPDGQVIARETDLSVHFVAITSTASHRPDNHTFGTYRAGFWSGRKESNLCIQLGKLLLYH
jgi:hypothetical protein